METENYKSLEAKPLFDSQNRIESLFDRLSGVIKKNKNSDDSVKEGHWSDDQQQEWEELRAEIETSKENIQVIYNPDGTIYDEARSKRTNSFWRRIQLIDLGVELADIMIRRPLQWNVTDLKIGSGSKGLETGKRYSLKYFESIMWAPRTITKGLKGADLKDAPDIIEGGLKIAGKGLEHAGDVVESSLGLAQVTGKAALAVAKTAPNAIEAGLKSAEVAVKVIEASPQAIEAGLKAIEVIAASPQAIEAGLKAAEAAVVLLEVAPKAIEVAAGSAEILKFVGSLASILK
jgi:hypothetical protein